jgi:ADP-ribose pyrophosphatase YjhB (NUDIX family)
VRAYSVYYTRSGEFISPKVYAVHYTRSGEFMIARKLKFGYYFYDAKTGGKLVPKGTWLNGAARDVLPGGRAHPGESIDQSALREFVEETGVVITNVDKVTTATFHNEGDRDLYAAAYFEISENDLTVLFSGVEIRLQIGIDAMEAVKDGSVKTYSELRERFPQAPLDNELETTNLWNVKNADDWKRIDSWKRDRSVNWYRSMLLYMKDNLV